MSERIVVHENDAPIYDIIIEREFEKLGKYLRKFSVKERKVCIVTDSKVARYHLDSLKKVVGDIAKVCVSHIIPEGEENKTLDQIQKIYETLIQNQFDRKDLLIALGGGVVGDMTGFAAATYLRGIDFIQVPTTLLSMVDSSIGGKTGVDFLSYKNMVGAFKMPILVYMNLSTLLTMEQQAFVSGMGEVIKHGLIKERSYFDWILSHVDLIKNRDLDALEHAVFGSCQIKRDVVEKDPTEKGDRALLNFGHTLGHAIEKEKNFELYHGSCVALGCIAGAYISYGRGYITKAELERVVSAFEDAGLPVEESELNPYRVISATKNDKKTEAGIIKFILLDRIGSAYIDRTVSEEEMYGALGYLGMKGMI